MNTNSTSISLMKNQSSVIQPVSNCESGQIGSQPPRNTVVASAETVVMLMYSARKNIANFSDEYSVWTPPTSSPSASGRSKGARFVSPTPEMAYSTNAGKSTRPNHRPCWALTICEVDSEPAYMNTATSERLIATS